MLKSFMMVVLAVFVLTAFASCKADDDLSKIFEDGELGDFWDLQADDSEMVPHPDGDGAGEDIIIDDDVLNMDKVRSLAFGSISPFEFMEKFPGTLTGTETVLYRVALPNDYVVRIEYSGESVNYIELEDHRLNIALNLNNLDHFDEFLLERNQYQQ